MVKKFQLEEASEKDKFLYSCIGESLFAIQLLEDALSHSIVLKKTEPNQKKEADILLKKQQSYTFGIGLGVAKKESLLPKVIENELSEFLKERNWFIHRSITENKKEYRTDSFYNKLFERTKAITSKAHEIRISIELDLIEYSEKKGISMSRVKNDMKKHYGI